MSVMDKIRRLLGLAEGHEDEIAEQVSKRTSVSKEKAKEGITKAQETINEGSNDESRDRNRS